MSFLCRTDFSTLVGQMKASANLVPKRKVQKSTGSTFAQVGMKSDVGSRGFQEVGAKKEWKWQRGIVTHPPSESEWNRAISA